MFGTMCVMPDDLTLAPVFDAFALRDLSVCGYYEPTNTTAEQAFLGEEGAHIQLDGIAVLETHTHTINRLIDRERENTAHIQEGQLCHAYGLWMVAQIRHNLDQIQRGEVPDWIDSTKLASLAGRSGPLDSRTLKGMTRVYPVIPDCEVSEATGVGMVLLIPVVTLGSGPFPLFHIENIGVIRENASLKYILEHHTPSPETALCTECRLQAANGEGQSQSAPTPYGGVKQRNAGSTVHRAAPLRSNPRAPTSLGRGMVAGDNIVSLPLKRLSGSTDCNARFPSTSSALPLGAQ
ncbi:hypothetical protein chiPu_0026611 [Chiloscyllium punctatum]|uniref:Uncharacterized protein n=1 Tax=Chiloscyllium punctatum TaxID=137246 RepID=A0A401TIQ2_CHIPU|nr:hypothetical protein [Chiloscyllium punctatum]